MGNSESLRTVSTFDEHRDCLREDDTETPSLEHVAKKIKDGEFDQIIVLAGAGISVSAGIPDFRSPGSGLYDNLGKYNLPSPEAIFDIDFFDQNPYPFFRLAGELFPGKFRPTPTHYFLTLLEQKKVLRRVFTQNIDTLESVAGLPENKYVACHGNFSTATCRRCNHTYSQQWMESKLFVQKEITLEDEDRPNIPIPRCEECDGIVKPDITFFGESLPPRFENLVVPDAQRCDLLLVMGTSLKVYPVGRLPDMVGPWVPRVLFNREPVHIANKFKMSEMMKQSAADLSNSDSDNDKSEETMSHLRDEDDEEVVDEGFWFNFGEDESDSGEKRSCNYRDVFASGNCDDTVREFVELLGWTEEFDLLIKEGNERFDAAFNKERMEEGEEGQTTTKTDAATTTTNTNKITDDDDDTTLSNAMANASLK
jgi:NAD-dependent deacetylase sirtuin 2